MTKSLCCISLKLQEQKIRASTMTKTRFLALERKTAEKTVADRTLNNVYVTRKTLEYCALHKWNYRVSSGMMPLETLPEANLSIETTYNYTKIKQEFDLCASVIKKNNIRCSTHPDQFVVPASANQAVVKKSIIELEAHGKMMDAMGLPQTYESPINIHMNCYKGNLDDIALRFIDVYNSISPNVKSRLVLELEDKPNSWGLIKLYDLIYQKTGIPITYDSHHFRLNNPENISPEKAILMCMETWGKYKPLFHYSNGRSGPTDRAHSDYVYILHKELFENDVDVEFEFKAKDYAIERFEKEFKI
jgi:UV DNA damage endonuclease